MLTRILKRKCLFTGTVPVNKIYPTGTVPVNKNYPTGSVFVNKTYASNIFSFKSAVKNIQLVCLPKE